MAIGFDLLGVTLPAGLFTPSVVEPTTRTTGARWIDPVTGDYAVDANSQFKRMPSLRQRVLIALKQVRDSGPGGLGFTRPDRVTERFEAQMRDAVNVALEHLTRTPNPAIVNLRVTVESTATGRALTLISYEDATTGRTEGVQF